MKAVIKTGGKQYVVSEGDVIRVEKLASDKDVTFEPLMIVDGDKSTVGTPVVSGAKVKAKVLDLAEKQDKIKVMKFKAKKRVKTLNGHRQKLTKLEILSISK